MPTRTELPQSVVTFWFPLLLIIASAGYYFWFLYQYAVNIPLQDEIYEVLNFMSAVVKSDDWHTTLRLFFNNYNDHRTASSRLIYYGAYLVQGEVNFRTLTILANLALPLLLVLFYLRVRDQQYRWLLLLPAAFFLFQLRAYGIMFWSMSAFAFFYAFLYGFCCVYLLHEVNRTRFFIAIVFAALANFSLASGQIVWLLGLVSLLHQGMVQKSVSIRYALYWLLIAIVALMVWQCAPSFEPIADWGLPSGTTLGAPPAGAPFLESFIHLVQFFLLLLGSFIGEGSKLFAATLGGLSLAVLAWVSVNSYRETDIRLELCWWYVVLTIAAVAVGRADFLKLEYALNSRYSILSILMLATAWTLLAVKLNIRSIRILLLVSLAVGLFSFDSYVRYAGIFESHINGRIKFYNRQVYPALGYTVQESGATVKEAISLGIYKNPPRPLPLAQVTVEGIKGVQLRDSEK